MTQPIPQPPPLPILGNLLDLRDPEAPIYALENLAETYGPIYKLTKGKTNIIVVSSIAMVEELMDEMRFVKAPPLALGKRRRSLERKTVRIVEDGRLGCLRRRMRIRIGRRRIGF